MRTAPGQTGRAQRGAALAVVMMVLAVVLLLGAAAARTAVFGDKAARNDRDRQLALHAAEVALLDAAADIGAAVGPRAAALAGAGQGLVLGACGRGTLLGLCLAQRDDAVPAWLATDLLDHSDAAASAPYGRFTARTFPAGGGPLSARPPRYLIEVMRDVQSAPAGADAGVLYRVTAIGFGARDATRVVLQGWVRRAAAGGSAGPVLPAPEGRREITNWSELRDENQED